jgi:hypothetical protein
MIQKVTKWRQIRIYSLNKTKEEKGVNILPEITISLIVIDNGLKKNSQ